jgi:hypothetical protein
MTSEKFVEIGGLLVLECFECEGGNFKGNALTDRKPVKLLESWSYMIGTFKIWKNNTGKGILDTLKAVN